MTWLSVLCLCGWLGHHLSILAQMSQDRGAVVTPACYVRERPYRFALSVVGTLAGFGVLAVEGQLSALDAVGVGWVADSVFHRAGKLVEGIKWST